MTSVSSIKNRRKRARKFSEKLRIAFYDVFEELFGETNGRVILSYLEIKTRGTRVRMNMDELFTNPERALELMRTLFGDTTYNVIERKVLEALSELYEIRCNREQDLKTLIKAIRRKTQNRKTIEETLFWRQRNLKKRLADYIRWN